MLSFSASGVETDSQSTDVCTVLLLWGEPEEENEMPTNVLG